MLKNKIIFGFIGSLLLTFPAVAEDFGPRHWSDGVYVGFGIARTVNVGGGMTSEYGLQSSMVGEFQPTPFQNNNGESIQFSAGKAINDNLRLEVSYMRHSGISTSGIEGWSDSVGDISSNTTMLNVYYNIDDFIGRFWKGMFRPYVGAGIGVARNGASNWISARSEDGRGRHIGEETRSFAYSIEGGATSELGPNLELDIFTRWTNLGRVASAGNSGYDEIVGGTVSHNRVTWRERGSLSVLDVGIRLRLKY